MVEKMPRCLEAVVDFLAVARRSIEDNAPPESILERYVAFRDKKRLTKLYEKFSQVYGPEGEKIAFNPSKAVFFNGGVSPKNPEKYFPGHHFSLPLLAYVMRRALGHDDERQAYKQYINGVNALVKERNEDIEKYNKNIIDTYYADKNPDDPDAHVLVYNHQEHALENEEDRLPKFQDVLVINAYPSRNMIEKLCAPTLRALDNILERRAVQDSLQKMEENNINGGNLGGEGSGNSDIRAPEV